MSSGAVGGGAVGGGAGSGGASLARTRAATASPNFGFLACTDLALAEAAARAERYGFEEPALGLVQLRIFAERMARQVCAEVGLSTEPAAQVEVLRRLQDGGWLPDPIAELFHDLRRAGNRAAHGENFTQREGLHALREARHLAVWFYRAFRDPSAQLGLFVVPPTPSNAEESLSAELEQARAALARQEAQLRGVQQSAEEEAAARLHAQEEARRAYEDLEAAMALAEEALAQGQARLDEVRAQLEAEFEARLAQAIEEAGQARSVAHGSAASQVHLDALLERIHRASESVEPDEAQTRQQIDAQLRGAGWEVDSAALTYAAGARPVEGRNLAIAEWPLETGRADYVLFVGLVVVGVVEAKRAVRDVAGSLEQAKRYSRGYQVEGAERLAGGPWGEYRVPFLFSTNGRPYLRQLRGQSGVWFWDARAATNLARPLAGWYSPAGLADLLAQGEALAALRPAVTPLEALPLRDYQRRAIEAVERALAAGQRELLVAMATGTGKTRMALCLIYRLIQSGRFRRVLFLVDRRALGEQARGVFESEVIDREQTLAQLFAVEGLDALWPERDTRLHVATVQGMVRRLLGERDDDDDEGSAGGEPEPVPVDTYDCVIVDECHRGYALDREMSEAEMVHRRRFQDEYVSRYRRVLDHFDAARVGLTATPALHTTEIFGPPVFTYSYREAVADGCLVDHEPPIRVETRLSQGGIAWEAGAQVQRLNTASGVVELYETPDEIDVDVDGFNTQVITEAFNEAVCGELARQIDPHLPGKTLVFCASDRHADMVVMLLKESFARVYGSIEDDAVQKITSATDKPLEALRRYKNERLPKVAVTVDLLTTGVDVPEIVNLVFLRRVKSRILYEQMLGRATRLWSTPSFTKEAFRIFDAVDLYAAMQPYTQMLPVVARPNLAFSDLLAEVVGLDDAPHVQQAMQEARAKLQAKKAHLKGDALEAFLVASGGASVEEVLAVLGRGDVAEAREFFRARPRVGEVLDVRLKVGRFLLISEHTDEVTGVTQGYGPGQARPEDYLESFGAFVASHQNELEALKVAVQRPKELTRAALKELRLKLDAAGYPEAALRSAWARVSNQDIAASILGFVRQQALGSPLVPYEERVNRALRRVLASGSWTGPQRKWLERIAAQVKAETVVDREALDGGVFRAEGGGFRRLDAIFEGRLAQVLEMLHEAVWEDAG